jgi:Toxin SymE, type I toxin-antitoxin system
MRASNEKKLKRPNVRSLKIQPKTRFNKYSQKDVPEIKLCGEWLQRLGFEYGDRVMITSLPDLLIIQPGKGTVTEE